MIAAGVSLATINAMSAQSEILFIFAPGLITAGGIGLYMMLATRRVSEKINSGIDNLKVSNKVIIHKLDNIDNKLDKIDNKIDKIDNKFGKMVNILQSIDKTLREKL